MNAPTSSAQQAASRTDAPRRSTRREIEAWLLTCAREGRTFQLLRNEYDGGGAVLTLRLDVCDVAALATS